MGADQKKPTKSRQPGPKYILLATFAVEVPQGGGAVRVCGFWDLVLASVYINPVARPCSNWQ